MPVDKTGQSDNNDTRMQGTFGFLPFYYQRDKIAVQNLHKAWFQRYYFLQLKLLREMQLKMYFIHNNNLVILP